ncbi:putative sugar transport protein [Pseudomonas amygdali pv. eriobotryae]|uniref:Putative sugar transport protein n=2 Tax=Pseudomonas amygdali TaxID=47877 RepID=A0A0P9SG55_PSEA0|nr:putative sugar transport protein [Pseudomonas amygdali pv. eriobotryae]RML98375.1 putative sugar transport protein [Pseudomonas amygdali pv. eriobotryae]RMO62318.1 putative sugar transport protein [Pseudomonas amygdali pv. eriobotryae]
MMHNQPLPAQNNQSQSLLWSAIAAAMVMAIGMGFGRFAYTGVYPAMVHEGIVSLHDGTLAASANYAGYLLGALLAARLSSGHSRRWVIVSILASVVGLIALAYIAQPWLIISIRGVAGLFSALSMIAVSQWLLQHKGHHEGAPILFSGVGIGIFLSAEILAIAQGVGFNSFNLWLTLGVSSAVLSGIAIKKLDKSPTHLMAPSVSDASGRHMPLGAWPLIAAYGLAGFGYIITATYLPMLVKSAFGDMNPVHIWAVFGLGAAPSCYLWHKLHLRFGTHVALRANLLLQAFGVILPVISPGVAGYVGSALIVGGTFMGTVTIAMPAAKRVSHTIKHNLIAVMTAAYGIGQIIGPLLASYLFAYSGSFNTSLIAAGVGLVLSTLLTVRFPSPLQTGR